MGKINEQLSLEERTKTQIQLEAGFSATPIAFGMNRSPSTISRELRRNGWLRPKARPGPGRPSLASGYRFEGAHK
jgi:IS30 family transposase